MKTRRYLEKIAACIEAKQTHPADIFAALCIDFIKQASTEQQALNNRLFVNESVEIVIPICHAILLEASLIEKNRSVTELQDDIENEYVVNDCKSAQLTAMIHVLNEKHTVQPIQPYSEWQALLTSFFIIYFPEYAFPQYSLTPQLNLTIRQQLHSHALVFNKLIPKEMKQFLLKPLRDVIAVSKESLGYTKNVTLKKEIDVAIKLRDVIPDNILIPLIKQMCSLMMTDDVVNEKIHLLVTEEMKENLVKNKYDAVVRKHKRDLALRLAAGNHLLIDDNDRVDAQADSELARIKSEIDQDFPKMLQPDALAASVRSKTVQFKKQILQALSSVSILIPPEDQGAVIKMIRAMLFDKSRKLRQAALIAIRDLKAMVSPEQAAHLIAELRQKLHIVVLDEPESEMHSATYEKGLTLLALSTLRDIIPPDQRSPTINEIKAELKSDADNVRLRALFALDDMFDMISVDQIDSLMVDLKPLLLRKEDDGLYDTPYSECRGAALLLKKILMHPAIHSGVLAGVIVSISEMYDEIYGGQQPDSKALLKSLQIVGDVLPDALLLRTLRRSMALYKLNSLGSVHLNKILISGIHKMHAALTLDEQRDLVNLMVDDIPTIGCGGMQLLADLCGLLSVDKAIKAINTLCVAYAKTDPGIPENHKEQRAVEQALCKLLDILPKKYYVQVMEKFLAFASVNQCKSGIMVAMMKLLVGIEVKEHLAIIEKLINASVAVDMNLISLNRFLILLPHIFRFLPNKQQGIALDLIVNKELVKNERVSPIFLKFCLLDLLPSLTGDDRDRVFSHFSRNFRGFFDIKDTLRLLDMEAFSEYSPLYDYVKRYAKDIFTSSNKPAELRQIEACGLLSQVSHRLSDLDKTYFLYAVIGPELAAFTTQHSDNYKLVLAETAAKLFNELGRLRELKKYLPTDIAVYAFDQALLSPRFDY